MQAVDVDDQVVASFDVVLADLGIPTQGVLRADWSRITHAERLHHHLVEVCHFLARAQLDVLAQELLRVKTRELSL